MTAVHICWFQLSWLYRFSASLNNAVPYCAGSDKQYHREVVWESFTTPFYWITRPNSVSGHALKYLYTHIPTRWVVHRHLQARILVNHSASARLPQSVDQIFHPQWLFLLLHTLSISSCNELHRCKVSVCAVQHQRRSVSLKEKHRFRTKSKSFKMLLSALLIYKMCMSVMIRL